MVPGRRRTVTEELVNAFKKVSGKERILFKVAEASLAAPDGLVRQVVFPAVAGGEVTLRIWCESSRPLGRPIAVRCRPRCAPPTPTITVAG